MPANQSGTTNKMPGSRYIPSEALQYAHDPDRKYDSKEIPPTRLRFVLVLGVPDQNLTRSNPATVATNSTPMPSAIR